MIENERRKFVLDAEFFVASHRTHKIFTVEDVIDIAMGFAEKYITKKDEQIEKMKCCENCKHSDTECEGYTICGIGHYDDCLSNKIFDHTTNEKDYWEIKEK